MDQRFYYVVEIDDRGYVFENIGHAASFMCDAAEHNKQGRYNFRRADITMRIADYETLCFMFPEEYKKEDDADEDTACAVPDQTES